MAHFTPNPIWTPTLDQLMQQLADNMPSDGTEYRIGHVNATHSRPEIKRPGEQWKAMRNGIGFLEHSKTYWMLVFAVETLCWAQSMTIPHYRCCPFCGLSQDDTYPEHERY